MITPQIVGIRLASPLPPAGAEACLATLTVEDGPWIIAGLRLYMTEAGKLFIRPPKLQHGQDRITIRSGPARTALLEQASNMVRGLLEVRAAASPLATAPETAENASEQPD